MEKSKLIPDSTAERVALWRAMHVEIDQSPHIVEDVIGLKLINPDDSWKHRPDMHPQGTAPFRASIVARTRFIEDLVAERAGKVDQYVILGSGLDTFAQRRPEIASKFNIFEIDKAETLAWKKQRLEELGYPIPSFLKFVSVDFEQRESWWDQLIAKGFDPSKPTIVSSLGVSMYLSIDSIKALLTQTTKLAPHSIFIMTFMLPLEHVAPEDRFGYERSLKGAQASGTPFISFFLPDEMLDLARECGFKKVTHTSTYQMREKYFANRTDGLRPSTGEEILLAEIDD